MTTPMPAERAKPRVIVTTNTKGGTGKSTSTAFMAHTLEADRWSVLQALLADAPALVREGADGQSITHMISNGVFAPRKVMIIDADPQCSIRDWAVDAGAWWTLPVVEMAVPTLHRKLWDILDPNGHDVFLIDTPPIKDEHGQRSGKATGIVSSALQLATDVVIPLGPSTIELRQLPEVLDLIEGARGNRDDDPDIWISINRTVYPSSSTTIIREAAAGALEDYVDNTNYGGRVQVLRTEIKRRDQYSMAYGAKVEPDQAYARVITEMDL